MKLSEYIALLEEIQALKGPDIEVMSVDCRLVVREARVPMFRNMLILEGREHLPRFWNNLIHDPSRKGREVVEV